MKYCLPAFLLLLVFACGTAMDHPSVEVQSTDGPLKISLCKLKSDPKTYDQLVQDDSFKQFDKLIWSGRDSVVHATIAGRFFSGEQSDNEVTRFGGYGHMGCCSLLAIQQIVSVDPRESRLLKLRDTSTIELTQSGRRQGRFIYWWRPKDASAHYMVVVSRPYMLSFYAKDPKRVAWVLVGAFKMSCGRG